MTRVPIHPMLVALLPVLSMYAVIPGVSGLDEIVRAAVVAIAIAGALLLIAAASYRDTRKAALLVSVFLLVLITFDKAYRPLSGWTFAGWHLLRPRFVLLASYLLLVAFAVWLMRTRRSFILTTVVANLAALGFLLPPVWLLLTAQVRAAESVRRVAALPPISAPATSHVRPDIFYLIFDRYGDEQTLRSYGFDNEPLYAYLSDHGFYVARASRSNYLRTILSLASSLNLTYLDDLTDKVGRDADTWQPLYDRVRDHRVAAFLHSQGYSYIHAGSWYTPTTLNPNAERNINCYTLAPYPMMRFLDSELIRPFTRRTDLLDRRRQQWWRVKRQIDEVLKLAPLRGPKLVFMHILVPHTPFVFDRDGAYVSADVEGRRTRQQNYINQVIAANAMIRRLVEGIRSASKHPPVILIQSDEGPYPAGTNSGKYDWRHATAGALREKSGILNAYYLPGVDTHTLYDSITPVNSFRIVFNTYFGTGLPLLPDHVYGHESEYRPYAFFEVTDRLRPAEEASLRTTREGPAR